MYCTLLFDILHSFFHILHYRSDVHLRLVRSARSSQTNRKSEHRMVGRKERETDRCAAALGIIIARTHSPHAHAMPAACLPLVRQDNPFGALPSGVSNRGHFLFLTDAVIHTSSMHTMHTPDRAKPTGFPSNDRISVAVSSPCCACGMVGYLVKVFYARFI